MKWTPVFGPAGAIAKVDRPGAGTPVVDFRRSAVVQRLMWAFVAIESALVQRFSSMSAGVMRS